MKIKKGTLVLLLNKSLNGSKMPSEMPLRRCLGLVSGTDFYDFGKGFQVKTFLGSHLLFREKQIVALVQVKPSLRNLGLKELLKIYYYSIALRFIKGVLRLNKFEL